MWSCKFRHNGFFCQLSPDELKDFDAIKHVSAYPADAILFMEQQKITRNLFALRSEVKLSFNSAEARRLPWELPNPGRFSVCCLHCPATLMK